MKLRKKAYSFDDVLLEPRRSTISSRMGSDISTTSCCFNMSVPIVSSNMDTITESTMMIEMDSMGAAGILHRFMSHESVIKELTICFNASCRNRIFSVGLEESHRDLIYEVYHKGLATGVCVDVAHGDCSRVANLIRYVKKHYSGLKIIAGNVATAHGAQRLHEAGADIIKVGVGGGSLCTTRVVTGCGVPQLTAISECANAVPIPVIADGGIKNSGDIVKALAAGAKAVMIGSLLSGAEETPGDIIEKDYENIVTETGIISISKKKYKKYQGMASRDAMIGWKGCANRTPEGESKLVAYRGPVENIIKELMGGLRSGMAYLNAHNLEELKDNAVFIPVTPLGYGENGAHGLK